MMTKHKIGRNERCPCGSGKKYKFCCGSPAAAPLNDFVATARTGDILNVYGSELLVNRVDREASAIAKDFDKLCHDHLVDIEELYSTVASLHHFGLTQAKQCHDEMRYELAIVLSNALKSFTA